MRKPFSAVALVLLAFGPAATAAAPSNTPAVASAKTATPKGARTLTRPAPLQARMGLPELTVIKPSAGDILSKLPPPPPAFVVVHNFSGTPAAGRLTLHGGRLYGITYTPTSAGGPSAVFRYTPGKTAAELGTVDVLHAFPTDRPSFGDLAVDKTGALYGTNQTGGAHQAGYLYRIAPNGDYAKLYDYKPWNGNGPFDTVAGPLLADPQGDVFGASRSAITKLLPNTTTPVLRVGIPSTTNDGTDIARSPVGTIFAATFFGDCSGSDPLGYGALVEMRVNAPLASCLVDADKFHHGSFGSLNALDDDTIIGTTSGYLPSTPGVVFKWVRGFGPLVLHTFDLATEGLTGDVVRAADGNFYGSTFSMNSAGGQYVAAGGVIYRMTPTGAVSVIHKFTCGADGCVPSGLVVHDGYLYGITEAGGAHGLGGLFRYKLP